MYDWSGDRVEPPTMNNFQYNDHLMIPIAWYAINKLHTRNRYIKGFFFRNGPVPGIGKFRGRFRRRIKIWNEIKQSIAFDEDNIPVRGRRSKRVLTEFIYDQPTCCGYKRGKGWKRSKKRKQWMKSNDVHYKNKKLDWTEI